MLCAVTICIARFRCAWSAESAGPSWSRVDAIPGRPERDPVQSTQPGSVITLRGRGMPHLRSNTRGDLRTFTWGGGPDPAGSPGRCARLKGRATARWPDPFDPRRRRRTVQPVGDIAGNHGPHMGGDAVYVDTARHQCGGGRGRRRRISRRHRAADPSPASSWCFGDSVGRLARCVVCRPDVAGCRPRWQSAGASRPWPGEGKWCEALPNRTLPGGNRAG